MKENLRLGPFQTQILECRTKPPWGKCPCDGDAFESRQVTARGSQPLPPGLHVLHTYTRLKMSSSRVSVVVRNMSESPIFLKKGVQVVSTLLVPPTELSPEMETTLGTETTWEPMSVTTHQEKLLEKLNLDGLSNWTPQNAMVAKELILAFHDILVLDENELGCTSAIEHKICINDSEPSKSDSNAYLHCF